MEAYINIAIHISKTISHNPEICYKLAPPIQYLDKQGKNSSQYQQNHDTETWVVRIGN